MDEIIEVTIQSLNQDIVEIKRKSKLLRLIQDNIEYELCLLKKMRENVKTQMGHSSELVFDYNIMLSDEVIKVRDQIEHLQGLIMDTEGFMLNNTE